MMESLIKRQQMMMSHQAGSAAAEIVSQPVVIYVAVHSTYLLDDVLAAQCIDVYVF